MDHACGYNYILVLFGIPGCNNSHIVEFDASGKTDANGKTTLHMMGYLLYKINISDGVNTSTLQIYPHDSEYTIDITNYKYKQI
jgi:hypothetical protein